MYHISDDIRSKKSAERIYNALEGLLTNQTLFSITISKLVEEALVGRTTFYRCFDSLIDVLQYKCDQEFILCGKFLHESIIVEKKYPPEDTFILAFLDYWHENTKIIELILKVDQTQIINHSFKLMIKKLIKKYPFIEDQLPHFDYLIEVRSSIAIAILTQWIRNDFDLTPKELSSIFKKKMIFDEFIYSLIDKQLTTTVDNKK